MRPALIGLLVISAAMMAPRAVRAQRPEIQAAILTGTGISLGMGSANTIARRSATALAVEISGSSSERPWIRYGGTIRGELEGKVTLGLIPQVTLLKSFSRLWIEGVAGIPPVIAPRSLYGLEQDGFPSGSPTSTSPPSSRT